jgi:hypothetical protein
MMLVGGFVTRFYFGEKADGLLALHVGVSTPLLLQKLVASIPDKKGARDAALDGTSKASVKEFFRW